MTSMREAIVETVVERARDSGLLDEPAEIDDLYELADALTVALGQRLELDIDGDGGDEFVHLAGSWLRRAVDWMLLVAEIDDIELEAEPA